METAYDFGYDRKNLVLSPSLVYRSSPEASVSLASPSATPYVTHLISPSKDLLLSYSDDGFFRCHDKASLKVATSFKWDKSGGTTSLVSTEQGYMATGRNGVVGCWDARQHREVACLAGPSRAPYLSLASSGNTVAVGTELQGVDASIDIWDLRQPSKVVMSYVEAHSDDVTSLSFHSDIPFALLSASSDSLVVASDIRKTDEDDSVLGVINTGASVARAGWGGSSTIRPKAKLEDEEEEGTAQSDVPSLGAFWSVSDMQTVGIWEADGWEEVLPSQDIRQGEVLISPEWKTEYVIDASANSQLLPTKDSIAVFCGNQDGSTALIEVPNQYGQDWTMHCLLRGGHSEVVRSALWDINNSCVFTGAEDGLICAWQLTAQSSSVSADVPISNHPSSNKKVSPGVLKEERQRSTYKPY